MNTKKLLKLYFLLVSVFALTFCLPSVSFAKEKLTLCCVEFAPFFYINSDGEISGTLVNTAQQIISEAGYDIKYKIMPPKRVPIAIAEGSVDVWFGLTSTLKDIAVISKHVVASMNLTSYTIGTKELIKTPQDLIGKKIVILRGYTYGGLISFIKDPENFIEYHEVNSQEAAINFLKLGRADYLLDYEAAIKKFTKNNQIKNLSAQLIQSLDIQIAIPKIKPNAKELLAELVAAHQRITNQNSTNKL